MSISKIIIFIVIAIALIWGGVVYNRWLDERAEQEAVLEQEQVVPEEAAVAAELTVEDLIVGTGEEVKNGNVLSMHYEGTLEDGTKFDSSYDRGEPFTFTVGAGQVINIKGWDLGILGMKVGGKRALTIPPELGYGERSVGSIPPNSTLKFTVELLSIESTN